MGGSLVRNGFDFSFSHDIYDEHVTAYGVDSYRYHGKELEPVRLGLLSVPVLEKNPLEDFTFKKSIASGAFSTVYKGVSVDKKSVAALKEIHINKLNRRQCEELRTEVNVLSQLQHECVVGLFSVYIVRSRIYLAMEYLRGGQLLQFMFEKGKLDEKTTQMILLQLADAVSYLHARRIMHRDLKPENIIMENHTNDVKVKIVDFGFATIDNELTNSPAKTICGTAGYLAPEVLKTRIYSRKVDIWSLGVITFIMLSGSMPFETSFTDENTREGIYTFAKSRWKHVTKSAKSIVARMLNVDTEKRLTAVDVLNHPWLAKASDDVYSVVSNGSRRPSVDSRRSSIDSQDYNSSPHAKTPKSIWSPRKLSKVLPEIIEKNDTPCESMKLPGEIAVEEKLVQDEEVRIEEERPFSDNIDTNGDETDTFVMLRSTKMTKNSENTQSADNLRSSRFRENNGSSKKHKSLDFRDDTYVGDGYAVENESDDDDDACHEKIKKWVSEDDADMDTLGLTFGADKGSKPVHIPKIDLGYNNSVSPMSDFNGDNHSSSGVVSHWHKDFYDMNANESGYEWIKNMFTRDSMDANMHQMNTYKSTVTLIGSKDSKNSDDHEVFETVFYRSSKAVHPSCPTTVNSDTSMNDSYYSRMFTPRLGPNDRPVFEASD